MILLLNEIESKESLDRMTDSYESSYKKAESTKEKHINTE